MSTWTIRPARKEDAERMEQVINAAYRGEGGWTTEAHLLGGKRAEAAELRQLVDESLANPSIVQLYVGVQDETVMGTISVTATGDGIGEIGFFSVWPHTQGGGLGSLLLRKAETQAAEHMMCKVTQLHVVHVRDDLLAFYERKGYVRTPHTEPFPEEFACYRHDLSKEIHFVILQKQLL